MKFLNGDRAKDSSGTEWVVWASQLVKRERGLHEHCLCYSEGDGREVKVFLAAALEKVEESEA